MRVWYVISLNNASPQNLHVHSPIKFTTLLWFIEFIVNHVAYVVITMLTATNSNRVDTGDVTKTLQWDKF